METVRVSRLSLWEPSNLTKIKEEKQVFQLLFWWLSQGDVLMVLSLSCGLSSQRELWLKDTYSLLHWDSFVHELKWNFHFHSWVTSAGILSWRKKDLNVPSKNTEGRSYPYSLLRGLGEKTPYNWRRRRDNGKNTEKVMYAFQLHFYHRSIVLSCSQKLESTQSKKRKKIEKSPLIPLPIDNLCQHTGVHLSKFILFLRTAIYWNVLCMFFFFNGIAQPILLVACFFPFDGISLY